MWLHTIGSFKPLFSHLSELIEGRSVSHRQCLAHRRECWIKGKYIKIHNKKLFFLFEIPDTTSLPPKLYFYLCFLIIMIKCMIKKYTLSSEHWRCKMFFLFARDLEFNKLKKNIVLEGKESYISGNNHQQSYHLQDTQFCTWLTAAL